MRWEGPALARFVRDAGFYGDAVPVAVALAVATSGGIDHYRHVAAMPGAGDWRGLWGVDVDRFPEYASADLYSPQVNAQAAHRLTAEHKGWHWNDAYQAATWQRWHAQAAVDASRAMARQPVGAPNPVRAASMRHDTFTDDLARRHATLAALIHTEG